MGRWFKPSLNSQCGISSFGRTTPCQGVGNRFEPGIPLQSTSGATGSECCDSGVSEIEIVAELLAHRGRGHRLFDLANKIIVEVDK